MVKIFELDAYRQQQLLRAAFQHWCARFDQNFQAHTGLADLTPATLYLLSLPGEETVVDLNTMIIGLLGFGAGVAFEELDSTDRTRVLDIQLFLSDQIRFEMMRRLGWLDRFAGNRFSLLEMVRDYERVKQVCSRQPPTLARAHADYDAYCPLFDLDQQVFLRRLFPDAMDAFKETHHL